MQKLATMCFEDSQLLNNNQQQNILGGQRHKTETEGLDGKMHKDVWKDRNNNGVVDEGDVVKIKYMVVPIDPGDNRLPLNVEEMNNNGVIATWCDTCEDWDNSSTSDECCDL